MSGVCRRIGGWGGVQGRGMAIPFAVIGILRRHRSWRRGMSRRNWRRSKGGICVECQRWALTRQEKSSVTDLINWCTRLNSLCLFSKGIATIPSSIPKSWRFLHPSLVINSSRLFPNVSHVFRYGRFFSESATQSRTFLDSTTSPKRLRSGYISCWISDGRYTVDVVINCVILVLTGSLCETYMLTHVAGPGHPAAGLERLGVLGRTL